MILVRLLGPARVEVDGEEIGLAPRAIGVLVRLALDGGWVRTDRLLIDLWGADVDARRRRSLQTLVSTLRRTLGGNTGQFIEYRNGAYRLPSGSVRIDTEWFTRHVASADAAHGRDDPALAGSFARAALELWDGDLGVAALGTGFWVEELESTLLDGRQRMVELLSAHDDRERPGIDYVVERGRYLAHSSFGTDGPTLLLLGGLATHLEGQWDEPGWTSWVSRLASFGRVVCFDKRGTGLSDPIATTPTIDDFVHDARSVLDAVCARDVVVLACAEAGLFAPRLAATDERTRGVVFVNAIPKVSRDDDFDIGVPTADSKDFFAGIQDRWGADAVALDLAAPSKLDDPDFNRWAARYQRLCTTPGNLRHLARFTVDADGRTDAAAVTAPSLVLQSERSRYFSPKNATWWCEHLPDAELVWLDSADHLYWLAEPDRALEEIERFAGSLSAR